LKFGGFEACRLAERCRYGLVKNLGTFNPVRIALHEYAGIVGDQLRPGLTWAERVGYFFGPPGWSRNGLSETTARLRAAEAARTCSAAPELHYGV
jgi:hypothetical protein